MERRTIRPRSAIWEVKESVVLYLEMPGVKKEGIEVTIEGDNLLVYGHRDGYAMMSGICCVRGRTAISRRSGLHAG